MRTWDFSMKQVGFNHATWGFKHETGGFNFGEFNFTNRKHMDSTLDCDGYHVYSTKLASDVKPTMKLLQMHPKAYSKSSPRFSRVNLEDRWLADCAKG